MRRYYEQIEFFKQPDGVQRYESFRYPKFEPRESDQYIITKQLDRLDIIAYDYYVDPTKWWVIARANNLPPGTFRVPAGTRLRIPYPLPDNELFFTVTNSQF